MLAGIATGVVLIAGLGLAVYALLQPGTPTDRIRDIFVIIVSLETLVIGVALVVLLVQLASLINLLQNEVRPILKATSETVNTPAGHGRFSRRERGGTRHQAEWLSGQHSACVRIDGHKTYLTRKGVDPMSSDNDEFGAFLVGFIVGGLTGAVVSLLFAPQSGEETRALIRDKSIELRDRASETAEEAMSRAEAAAAEARARAESLAKQARMRADDLAKEARMRADDLAKEVRARGEGALEAVRKTTSRNTGGDAS